MLLKLADPNDSKKRRAVRFAHNCQRPAVGCWPQPASTTNQLLRANFARSRYFALGCFAKTRAGFVGKTGPLSASTGSVLALPRSPESGSEVSMDGKILSRGKRKMCTTFSKIVHIFCCVSRETHRAIVIRPGN